jgi:peptide-methionine (S)-S-oxide reductase
MGKTMFHSSRSPQMPQPEEALPGRAEPITTPGRHYVNGCSLAPPYPEGMALAMFGMGCFWGAERRFWQIPGVYVTMAGYSAGFTPNPTYHEVCTGMTGHNEVVQLVYDPAQLDYMALLAGFWQSHDPTQGMRQGNDIGTQYRSGIYTFNDEQQQQAEASRARYQQLLLAAGKGQISTEIIPASTFYFAEEYHQQYLARNPSGYCGLGGTGVDYQQD